MNNREIHAAWKYHDGSKHSYWSIRNHPHSLDWANRPLPFKIYPKIEPLQGEGFNDTELYLKCMWEVCDLHTAEKERPDS